MPEPGLQTFVDLLLSEVRVVALEGLPHDIDPGLEQLHRDAESLGRSKLHRFFHTCILSFPRSGRVAWSEQLTQSPGYAVRDAFPPLLGPVDEDVKSVGRGNGSDHEEALVVWRYIVVRRTDVDTTHVSAEAPEE